jgi:hypothetical protein
VVGVVPGMVAVLANMHLWSAWWPAVIGMVAGLTTVVGVVAVVTGRDRRGGRHGGCARQYASMVGVVAGCDRHGGQARHGGRRGGRGDRS